MMQRITRPVEIPNHRQAALGVTVGVLAPGLITEEQARFILGEAAFDQAVADKTIEAVFDPLPHRGWPTAAHAATKSHIEPITPGAVWSVRCRCGAAFDSAVTDRDEAIASVGSAHRHEGAEYHATAYPPPEGKVIVDG
jgi:hypothetical protein